MTLKYANQQTQLKIKNQNQSPVARRLHLFKNKSRGHRSFTWKIPTLLGLLSLMMLILIIPTIIVTPFIKGHQSVAVVEEEKEKEKEENKQNINSPQLSVAVMRTNSSQIEDVPLEQYVAGVVASEMPVGTFEIEALKAQGLAARTYIVNHILLQSEDAASDVTDTTADQVYKSEEELRELWGSNFNEHMEKLTEAISATEGEILTYENSPIFPAFFSTSNGYTENSEDYWENELPHLRSVPSPWDEDSPEFLDQKIFTHQEIEKALNITLSNDALATIDLQRTKSQRVSTLIIGSEQFTGREIRENLGLKSSDFTIEQNNEHLIFTTKGYGHGIGMSQYGANFMAKEGKTYKDIVEYYYQDIEISTVTETAPTLVVK